MAINLSREEFEESCKEFLTFWNSPQNQNEQLDFNSNHFLKAWKHETHPINDRFGYLVSEALDRILDHKRSSFRKQKHESANEQLEGETLISSSQLKSESLEEELQDIEIPIELEDESIISTSSERKPDEEAMIIKFQTWVVYSETYRVPHFLFNAYKSDGTSLTLEELMRSNIYNRQTSRLSCVDDPHRDETSRSNLVDLEYPFNTLETSARSEDEDHNVILPFMTQVEHPFTRIPVWSLHPCNTAAVLEEMLTGSMDKLNSKVTIEAFLTLVNGLINLRRSST